MMDGSFTSIYRMHSLSTGAATHIGLVRSRNEDSHAVLASNEAIDSVEALLIVADGLGGHPAGDVASATAIEVFAGVFRASSTDAGPTDVAGRANWAVQRANLQVLKDAETLGRAGMATTLSGFLVLESSIVVVHVGDSRVYRLRNGRLDQLTTDHSLVQRLVSSGRIGREEAFGHPQGHVVERSLGFDPQLNADVTVCDKLPGDRLLACTDGVHGMIQDDLIAEILGGKEPQESADGLVDAANAAGGRDNSTAVTAFVSAR